MVFIEFATFSWSWICFARITTWEFRMFQTAAFPSWIDFARITSFEIGIFITTLFASWIRFTNITSSKIRIASATFFWSWIYQTLIASWERWIIKAASLSTWVNFAVITPWEIWIFKTAFIWTWSNFAYITRGMRFVMSATLFRAWMNFTWVMRFFRFTWFFMGSLFANLLFNFFSHYFFIECILIPVSLVNFNRLFFLFRIKSFHRNRLCFILFMMMDFFCWAKSFFKFFLHYGFKFFIYIFTPLFIFTRKWTGFFNFLLLLSFSYFIIYSLSCTFNFIFWMRIIWMFLFMTIFFTFFLQRFGYIKFLTAIWLHRSFLIVNFFMIFIIFRSLFILFISLFLLNYFFWLVWVLRISLFSYFIWNLRILLGHASTVQIIQIKINFFFFQFFALFNTFVQWIKILRKFCIVRFQILVIIA